MQNCETRLSSLVSGHGDLFIISKVTSMTKIVISPAGFARQTVELAVALEVVLLKDP